jgi:hypothetical protein
MALKPKRESKIKELVKEAMQEAKIDEQGFPIDPSLETDEEERNLGFDFISGEIRQKRKDEVVIDQLLQDINGKQGYFLKLKKEIRPNEWMLMKVIENEWRRWADIETAVADIVKEHTKHAPQKWGTGAYRVEISCKSGMRGKKYDPIDIYVNADEELVTPQTPTGTPQSNPPVDPSVQVASQMETLANLVSMIKQVLPQGPNPSDIQNQIASAFQQGMSLKANESNTTTTLLATMMTSMMGAMKDLMIAQKQPTPATVGEPKPVEEQLVKLLGVMKDFGVIGASPVKEKSVIDFATELKALGIDLFKKEEPLDQINKLKQIASLAADFMGMQGTAERPSILEKLIDVIGPAVPDIVKNVKETFDKAVTAQQIASQNLEKAKMLQSGTVAGALPEAPKEEVPVNTTQSNVQEQVNKFFDQVYEAVDRNNKMFYPIIYTSLLQDTAGVGLVNDVLAEKKGTKELIELLQTYGGERFKDQKFVNEKLIGYINGFVVWLKSIATLNSAPQQQKTNGYEVKCSVCGTTYEYDSQEEFLADTGRCDNQHCSGVLVPVAKV